MMRFICSTISVILCVLSLSGQVKVVQSVNHTATLFIYPGGKFIENFKVVNTESPEMMLNKYRIRLKGESFDEFVDYYVRNDVFNNLLPLFNPINSEESKLFFEPTYKLNMIWNGQKIAFIRGLITNIPFVYFCIQENSQWKILLPEKQIFKEALAFFRSIKPGKIYSLLQNNANRNPIEKEILSMFNDENGRLNLTSLISYAYENWEFKKGSKYRYYFYGKM